MTDYHNKIGRSFGGIKERFALYPLQILVNIFQSSCYLLAAQAQALKNGQVFLEGGYLTIPEHQKALGGHSQHQWLFWKNIANSEEGLKRQGDFSCISHFYTKFLYQALKKNVWAHKLFWKVKTNLLSCHY